MNIKKDVHYYSFHYGNQLINIIVKKCWHRGTLEPQNLKQGLLIKYLPKQLLLTVAFNALTLNLLREIIGTKEPFEFKTSSRTNNESV